MRQPDPSTRVAWYTRGVLVVATLAWLAAMAVGARGGGLAATLAGPTTVIAIALLAAYVAFQFWGFDFEWRGHWLCANLDEAVLFVGLLALPAAWPLVLIPVGEIAVQLVKRPAPIKAVFNVAQLTFAAVAAWDAFFLVQLFTSAPPLLAATLAVPVYVAFSNLLLAGVFSSLEDEPVLRVYAQRLASTTVVLSAVGLSVGIAVVALASLHPLALLALAPFVLALKRNTVLASRADRELRVHRALASSLHELVETWTFEEVADRILDASAAALPVGRARLVLHGGGAWSRDFEGGPRSDDEPHVTTLKGRDDEVLGTLALLPRAGQPPFGEVERALATAVAAQAASAVLHVRAIRSLEEAHEQALAQQDRLAKQEKLSALGMLVANVAHEIGNPLSYMRLSLRTLELEAARLAEHPDASVRARAATLSKGIETTKKGTESVVEIARSLRAVARQGREGRATLDLNDVARDVASVVRIAAPKSVAIELDLASAPVRVDANAGEITQVVLNLAKNAAEAIGERPGRVRLSTATLADGRAVVRVSDDGPGIPPATLDRLFTPFFTTKEQGTGIGLHISHGIARAHGGDLVCESTVGEGSTFTLSIPASISPSMVPQVVVT